MKRQSECHLLKGKIVFTNEPLWFRLLAIALLAGFLIAFAMVFKECSLLTIKQIGNLKR